MFSSPVKRYHRLFLLIVFIVWGTAVYIKSLAAILLSYWPVALTMIFGAFVAGSTALGGNAVAFPTLTKLLGYSGADARTFGLFIQSIGMTSASIYILNRRIPILKNVLVLSVPISIFGLLFGLMFINLEYPWKNIIFSIVLVSFGCAMVIMRFTKHPQHHRTVDINKPFMLMVLIVCSFVGGVFSSQVGTGADVLLFILLTLAFGIDIKIGTPTSVINMAAVSLAGFAYMSLSEVVSTNVFYMWMSAIPIVAIFAPLGAWFASKINSSSLFYWLIFMIIIESATTFWLIELRTEEVVFVVALILLMLIIYYGLIKSRE